MSKPERTAGRRSNVRPMSVNTRPKRVKTRQNNRQNKVKCPAGPSVKPHRPVKPDLPSGHSVEPRRARQMRPPRPSLRQFRPREPSSRASVTRRSGRSGPRPRDGAGVLGRGAPKGEAARQRVSGATGIRVEPKVFAFCPKCVESRSVLVRDIMSDSGEPGSFSAVEDAFARTTSLPRATRRADLICPLGTDDFDWFITGSFIQPLVQHRHHGRAHRAG